MFMEIKFYKENHTFQKILATIFSFIAKEIKPPPLPD